MYKVPSVTVVIPYKNNLKYLFIALKSVFNQNYQKFKIIIVYDDKNKSDLYKIKDFLKKNR
jgi:glycosyltransferase involved in cell wall biosynthesis